MEQIVDASLDGTLVTHRLEDVDICLSQALIHAIKQLNAVEAMEGLPDKHHPNCNQRFPFSIYC